MKRTIVRGTLAVALMLAAAIVAAVERQPAPPTGATVSTHAYGDHDPNDG